MDNERTEFTTITLENSDYKASVTVKEGDLTIDAMFVIWKDCMGGMGYHMDGYDPTEGDDE